MPDQTSVHSPGGSRVPSLIGRERESGLLRTHLERSLDGHGRLVLVRGSAGVGKTALVADLARRAAPAALVLTGHCYDQTTNRPYGPWIDLARSHDRAIAASSVSARRDQFRLGHLWGDERASAAPSQLALFETVLDALQMASKQQPVCIVLEDLHWSDPSSVDLLRYLGRNLANLSLLVIATYRDDELTAEHPLSGLLPRLVRETRADRITVQPLTRAALDSLVSDRYDLSSDDARRLATTLATLTQGNALYVSEMLHTFEEDGVLQRTPDGWRLGDVTRVQVPELLREVIDGRLSRLSTQALTALQIAAVIGQDVPVDLWGVVSQLDEVRLLDIADEAIEAGLLNEAESIAYLQFHHALIREALLGAINGPRRRVWHVRIAEAYAASERPEPDRVAHHFQQADDPRATDWLIMAGRRAAWSHAWVEAAEHFEAAARWLESSDARGHEYGWLLLLSGGLRRFDDPERGLRIMQQVLPVAAKAGDPLLTFQATFYAGYLRFLLGDMRGGLAAALAACQSADAGLRAGAFDAYLAPPYDLVDADASLAAHRERAVELVDQPQHPICLSWGMVTTNLAWMGYIQQSIEIGEQLAALWPPVPEQARLAPDFGGYTGSGWADLYNGLGIAYALAGAPDDADRTFVAARSIYQAIDHRMLVGDVYGQELELALLYRTEQVAERRYTAERMRDMYTQASEMFAGDINLPLVAASVWHALLEGRWSDVRAAAPAYATLESTVSFWKTLLGTSLAYLAHYQGDADRAWQFIHELLPQGATTEPGNMGLTEALLLQELAANLELDTGNLDGARMWIDAHDDWVEWSGVVPGRAPGCLLWARYQHLAGDNDAAQRQAQAALELATSPRQPLALLRSHRAIGELATVAGKTHDAEHHLTQSFALAATCALPYERALTLLSEAELRAACGDGVQARALLHDIRTICEPLGAALALKRADDLAAQLGEPGQTPRPAAISRREAEVLLLIAAGRSNKQIAAELAMSLRTVERHSANLYAKIGAASRAEAIAFAHQHGLTNR